MSDDKCMWKVHKHQVREINGKPFYMIYNYPTCCSDGHDSEYLLNAAFVRNINYCPYCGRKIEVQE